MSRFATLSSWFGRPALIVAFALGATPVRASEVIPPAPPHYFNDYAGAVSPGTAADLDAQLTQFERDSSNQLVVAIYPHMQSDSSIEDYTVRVAQSWGVGQKDHKNGVVLFVFINDRQTYIQVGYGLEGALPDATCHLIIENEIKPRFRAGDYDGGLRAAVTAIMQATRGEYKGTGQTVDDSNDQSSSHLIFLIFFVAFLVFSFWSSRRRSRLYGSSGSSFLWLGGGGGGGFGGGGGGGGGFSGGGGSFGGGGAGGSW
ncbi:MAG TPA: TPM domain-containing protein [Opitutaceae bacterium]|nr:TPM domain-containing protein [Opitutaceae bacterium]